MSEHEPFTYQEFVSIQQARIVDDRLPGFEILIKGLIKEDVKELTELLVDCLNKNRNGLHTRTFVAIDSNLVGRRK